MLQRRWRAELAVLSLLLAGLLGWRWLHPGAPRALPELGPPLGPVTISRDGRDRIAALELRVRSLSACDRGLWRDCLRDLDASVALAPETANHPLVQLIRARAQQALEWERVERVIEKHRTLPDYKSGP